MGWRAGSGLVAGPGSLGLAPAMLGLSRSLRHLGSLRRAPRNRGDHEPAWPARIGVIGVCAAGARLGEAGLVPVQVNPPSARSGPRLPRLAGAPERGFPQSAVWGAYRGGPAARAARRLFEPSRPSARSVGRSRAPRTAADTPSSGRQRCESARCGCPGAPSGRAIISDYGRERTPKPGGPGSRGPRGQGTTLKPGRGWARHEQARNKVARFALVSGEGMGGAGGTQGSAGGSRRLDGLEGSVGGWGIG